MSKVIELAKKCGFNGVIGKNYYCTQDELNKFYEAAKAEGAEEFKARLGEPVAWMNSSNGVVIGLYRALQADMRNFDIKLYALPKD